jgi:hypothetical protein
MELYCTYVCTMSYNRVSSVRLQYENVWQRT